MFNIQRFFDIPIINEGRIEFLHDDPAVRSSAFSVDESAKFRLYVPRSLGALNVDVRLCADGDPSPLLALQGRWIGIEGDHDVYLADFSSDIAPALYFLSVTVLSHTDSFFALKREGVIRFERFNDPAALPQLTVYDSQYPMPESIMGGVIYHIFVDRFNRGGKITPSPRAEIVGGEWEQIPEYPEYPGAFVRNNTFFGGTLYGVTEKLDYIKSLGVSAIYLSPVFTSPSNHRYDTSDYMSVDPMLGGDEALRKLILAAGKKGIKIILDGVFNHTGSDSIYFNKNNNFSEIGAYNSADSKYYEWYDFKDYPDKYTCWWDVDILPRINPDIGSCRKFFVGKDGVIGKYRKMGVYGMRLDVADELSDGFIADIKKVLSEDGESALYGEVWEDASNKIAYGKRKTYYLGSELDGVMNYPLRTGIIDYVVNKNEGSLRYALTEVTENAPPAVANSQMNLLGTHDTERILTVLGDRPLSDAPNSTLVGKRLSRQNRETALRALMAAYTVVATLPGIPMIFYGDEAGLEGYRDPFNRMPYPWGREEPTLLDHYRKLGEIRRNNRVYVNGSFRIAHLDSRLLVFTRSDGEALYVTVYNNSHQPMDLFFTENVRSLFTNADIAHCRLDSESADVFCMPLQTQIKFTD